MAEDRPVDSPATPSPTTQFYCTYASDKRSLIPGSRSNFVGRNDSHFRAKPKHTADVDLDGLDLILGPFDHVDNSPKALVVGTAHDRSHQSISLCTLSPTAPAMVWHEEESEPLFCSGRSYPPRRRAPGSPLSTSQPPTEVRGRLRCDATHENSNGKDERRTLRSPRRHTTTTPPAAPSRRRHRRASSATPRSASRSKGFSMKTSKSTACARSGGSCCAKGTAWLAARWRA